MSSADQYRRNACECVAVTSFFADPRQRATILALAEAWTRLAEQAERNEQVCALDHDPENPDKWVPAMMRGSRSPDRAKRDHDAKDSVRSPPARSGEQQKP